MHRFFLLFIILFLPVIIEAKGSVSIGYVNNGRLQNGESICRYHQKLFYAISCFRPYHFGTSELVEMVVKTAKKLKKIFPDKTLVIGNLSAKNGGEIPFSVSHQAGRDVDIGFFMKDGSGRQPKIYSFLKIKKDLSARYHGMKLFFDVEANFLLVKTLVQSAPVQWIFVANHLKSALLEYARKKKEKEELISRLSIILHQPSSSSPHDDHFHVRIFCSFHDLIKGCHDYYPFLNFQSVAYKEFDRYVKDFINLHKSNKENIYLLLKKLKLWLRSDFVLYVIKNFDNFKGRLKKEAISYLGSVFLAPFVGIIEDKILMSDCKSRDASFLLNLLSGYSVKRIRQIAKKAFEENFCSFSFKARVIKLLRYSNDLNTVLYVYERIKKLRYLRAIFLKEAPYIFGKIFKNRWQIEKFLKKIGNNNNLYEILYKNIKKKCYADKLNVDSFLDNLKKGDYKRFVTEKVLNYLFDVKFSHAYSDLKIYRKWMRFVYNKSGLLPLPCDFSKLREHIFKFKKEGRDENN